MAYTLSLADALNDAGLNLVSLGHKSDPWATYFSEMLANAPLQDGAWWADILIELTGGGFIAEGPLRLRSSGVRNRYLNIKFDQDVVKQCGPAVVGVFDGIANLSENELLSRLAVSLRTQNVLVGCVSVHGPSIEAALSKDYAMRPGAFLVLVLVRLIEQASTNGEIEWQNGHYVRIVPTK